MKKIMYRAVFNRKKQLRADGKGLIQIEAYLERRTRRAPRCDCLSTCSSRARRYTLLIYIGTTLRHSSACQPTPQ